MRVRPITESDVNAVVALIERNWNEVLSRYHSSWVVTKFRDQVSPESLRHQMSWKRVFVVETDERVVATGALADFGSADSPRHSVSNLFVAPDLHGQGIGTKLILYLFGVALAQGTDSLHVPSTRNAVPFYRKVGFVEDVEQPDLGDEITWMTKRMLPERDNADGGTAMTKYETLNRHLRSMGLDCWRASFEAIEAIIGDSLPRSARRYPAWWANDERPGRQSWAWLEAGYRTSDVDVLGGEVTFRRAA